MTIHKIKSTIDPSGQRSFPNISIETKLLIDHIKAQEEGTIIAYDDLDKLIDRPCRSGGSGARYLASARRILLRDYDLVLDAEPKVGVRVCTDAEKLLVAKREAKRSRRATKKQRQVLIATKYDLLDENGKKTWNAAMSQAAMLEQLAAPSATRKIEKVIKEHALPTATVLALFKA